MILSGRFEAVDVLFRLTIDSNGHIPSAISLSDEQMKFYNHLCSLRENVISAVKRKEEVNQQVLSLRALNEVYIGEYVATGTSYFELQADDEPLAKHKSSGCHILMPRNVLVLVIDIYLLCRSNRLHWNRITRVACITQET